MPKESKSEKLMKSLKIEKVEGNSSVVVPQKKSLNQIMNKLNNKNGEGKNKVTLASAKETFVRVPTGVLALDHALKGGFVKGRVHFLAGKESSYKSTICLRTIAEIQKNGGTAAWIDGEAAFDPSWAQINGVDLDKLLVLEPQTAEEAYNNMTFCILEGIDIVVLDSLNSLAVKKEMFSDEQGTEAGDISRVVMGNAQKLTSLFFRTNVMRIAKAKTCFLVIGQIRASLSANPHQNPETVTGGFAIRFYSSISIETRAMTGKTNAIVDANDDVIGKKFEFKITKNKTGKADKKVEFTTYGNLVDNYTAMLQIGLEDEFIQKPNNKTYICNGKSYNGKAAMIEALVTNSDNCYTWCEQQMREKMGANIYYPNPFEKAQEIAAAKAINIHEDENQVLLTDEEISALPPEDDNEEE